MNEYTNATSGNNALEDVDSALATVWPTSTNASPFLIFFEDTGGSDGD